MERNTVSDKGMIAVFDSGVGGISVLASVRRRLPEENFLFFADSENAPYGDKPTDEIRNLTLRNCRMLTERFPVKAILIACNTATSAAAKDLRSELQIPVLGVEPALKPAVEAGAGPILVLATQLTIREEKFRTLMGNLQNDLMIIPSPCPGLMEIVESNPESSEAETYLRRVLAECPERPKAIVLGCTHYVFLKPLLRRIAPDISLYDGNEGVSRHLKHVLTQRNALGGRGELQWLNSLSDSAYTEKCKQLYAYAQQKEL